MTKPWEKYATQPQTSGPWAKYSKQEQPRGWGDIIYENVVGRGEPDTIGEQVGVAINNAGATLGGMAAGVGRGALRVAGLPGDVSRGMDWVAKRIGLLDENAPPNVLSSESLLNSASAVTGGATDYKGRTPSDRILSEATEAGTQAFITGGGAQAVMPFGVVPYAASEVAGQLTEGTKIPDYIPVLAGMDAEPFARVGAALAAPLAWRGLESVMTPYPADPARLQAVDRLSREGVNVTAGQKVGSQNLRYVEDASASTQNVVDRQAKDFTKAVLRRIGVEADEASPAVLERASARIGDMFDDLAARNVIPPDAQMSQGAANVVAAYARNTSRLNIVPAIKDVATKIDEAVTSGNGISGAQYQTWRSELGRLSAKGDSNSVKEAARNLVNVLDDAMERSIRASGSTADIAAYQTARRQWRDFLAIADSVDGAGVAAASGIVTPQNLRGAVKAQDDMAYVMGKRDLGELARDGTRIMSPLPNSGTQQRTAAQSIGGAAQSGMALGGVTFGTTQNPTLAAAATLAGMFAPAARNAAMTSQWGQGLLGNQVFAQRTQPFSPAVIAALTGPAVLER